MLTRSYRVSSDYCHKGAGMDQYTNYTRLYNHYMYNYIIYMLYLNYTQIIQIYSYIEN